MEVSGRKEAETQVSYGENSNDIPCQPCLSEGDNVPAASYCVTCQEFICSSCLRAHRKLSLTKNHVIKSKDEMPQEQTRKDPCSELCANHVTEIVKFYCQNHNEVGCGDCMVLEHKACKVQLIQNVSGNYGNSEELSQLKTEIEHMLEEITSYRQGMESNFKAASEMNLKTVEEIKKFRKDINHHLDNAEAKLLIEVEQLKIKDESLQKRLQDECDSLEYGVQDIQNKLETLSEKVNQLFINSKLAQKRLKLYQESMARIRTEFQVRDINFKPSKDFMILNENESSLGSISGQLQKGDRLRQGKKSIAEMKTEFVKKLNIQVKKEKKCWITGLAIISADEILLADHYNYCLKILNVRESEITSKYARRPAIQPWDVTVISAGTAAATLPDQGRIMFVNTNNGLSESHSLNVRKGCRGIDHRNGIIAVSFCEPSALKIINIKGNVLHEISAANLFGWPGHISLSHDRRSIFVSDYVNCNVYELTVDGQLVATMKLKDGSTPEGLAVTSDGAVVVCCQSGVKGVSLIVPNSRQILPLSLDHVQKPTSIVVCEKQNKIYLCDFIYADPNYIEIFDMK